MKAPVAPVAPVACRLVARRLVARCLVVHCPVVRRLVNLLPARLVARCRRLVPVSRHQARRLAVVVSPVSQRQARRLVAVVAVLLVVTLAASVRLALAA